MHAISSGSLVDRADHSAGDASTISTPGKAEDRSPANDGVMASTPMRRAFPGTTAARTAVTRLAGFQVTP